MTALLPDLRYAFRTLRRTPVFTTVAVLSLALGIGANTAIFSLIDQVLLRPLPVPEPERLVTLSSEGPNVGFSVGGRDVFSYPLYRDLRDGATGFTALAGHFTTNVAFTHQGQSERVRGMLVTGNYFDTVGAAATIGRTLVPEDDTRAGTAPVAVLSHELWMSRFGGSAGVLNRTVRVNGHPVTVVGVAARGFRGVETASAPELFLPLSMKPQVTPTWDERENRRAFWLGVLGRLKPGVSAAAARAQAEPLYRRVLAEELKDIPISDRRFREGFVRKPLSVEPARPVHSHERTQFSTPLAVLMAMVGLVLLIACANVANLLLARAAFREREVAVRLALGAGKLDLLRQFLVESVVLSLLGGAVGLLLSFWVTSALLQLLPPNGVATRLSAEPDGRMLAFTIAVSVVTGLLFGLFPAFSSIRSRVATTLKNEATSVSAAGGTVRTRKALVVAQVALSLLLLVGAGLFARSLQNLNSLDPGFQANQLLTFAVNPALGGYDRQRGTALLEQLQERLARLPGVSSASVSSVPALSGLRHFRTVRVEGYRGKEGEDLNPDVNEVGPGYLRTLGVPLIAGREFTGRDRTGAPYVAVVNEEFARYFFGKANPIGRRIGFGRGRQVRDGEFPLDIEIVGVARDSKVDTLRAANRRVVYLPYRQAEDIERMTFYVRGTGDPGALATAVRREVRAADANLPLFDVKTMRTQVEESLFQERTMALLSAFFGLLATGLAAVGIYGVMAYTVARRTREIGIRVALGAARGSVVGMVVGEVARMALVGIGLGLPAAYALGRVVESQLFGLTAADPLTLAAATSLLLGVALVAAAVPALRATRVNPIVALRYE